MKRNLTWRETAAVASLLFGLFFGAGNLIFPVHMGQLAAGHTWTAVLGFIVTGVGLPLLGVASLGISRSEGLVDLAGHVGKKYATVFTCALYLTIGPFFAIPRCATTSFTVGIEPMITESSERLLLFLFSLGFFLLVLFFSLRPGGILTWIGKVINPIFLALLGILIAASLLFPMGTMESVEPDEIYQSQPLLQGFLEGYNTMDALAALAFGVIVIDVIRKLGITEPGDIASNTVKAGIGSCILMAVIYALTTLMGAKSMGALAPSDNGGIALAQIAAYYFGSSGQIILALIITLACLKTSIGLVTSCAETFHGIFPALGYKVWTVIFSAFSFGISNIGLSLLIAWSVPVLMLLYPLAITLILLNLFGKRFAYDRKVFLPVTLFAGIAALFDFIGALPSGVVNGLHLHVLIDIANKVLPLYSDGLGWVCPALIGLGIGLFLHFNRKGESHGIHQ